MPDSIIIDSSPPEISESVDQIQVIESDDLIIEVNDSLLSIESSDGDTITSLSESQVDTVASAETLIIENPDVSIALGDLSGEVKEARFDTVGALVYVGISLSANISETVNAWRIRRIDNSIPESPTVTSAGGQDRFSFAWSDHLTATYA